MAKPGAAVFVVDTRQLKVIPRMIEQLAKMSKADAKKPLKRWGDYMLKRTDVTFSRSGRGNIKWKPLAPMTIAMRKKKGNRSRKPLVVSGKGRRSFKTKSEKRDGQLGQKVFTRLWYMQLQHTGKRIRIPARTIRTRKAKVLSFTVSGKKVFATKVKQKARTVIIPRRKIVFVLPEDRKKAVGFLDSQITRTTREWERKKKKAA